jgi:hypothetical protein
VKKPKVRYAHINLERTVKRNGHEYLYFTTSNDGVYFEWQRGARTINIKAAPHFAATDLECFSMSYNTPEPDMRAAKHCILDYLNQQ